MQKEVHQWKANGERCYFESSISPTLVIKAYGAARLSDAIGNVNAINRVNDRLSLEYDLDQNVAIPHAEPRHTAGVAHGRTSPQGGIDPSPGLRRLAYREVALAHLSPAATEDLGEFIKTMRPFAREPVEIAKRLSGERRVL